MKRPAWRKGSREVGPEPCGPCPETFWDDGLAETQSGPGRFWNQVPSLTEPSFRPERSGVEEPPRRGECHAAALLRVIRHNFL